MYFLYVDESGDTGLRAGASPKFILSGLVLHELTWHTTLDAIIAFRTDLKAKYGLKLREEIHAKDFIHSPGQLARIPKSLRLRILRDVLDFMEALPDASLLHVVIDKLGKPAGYDVFDNAWRALLQRFHNTLSFRNFPGPRNTKDFGVVVADRTDEPKLRTLTRRLRRFNPVPNTGGGGYRQLPLQLLVEDAVHRDSQHSYFLQLVDVSAFFLYQQETPGAAYVRKKGGKNYFDRLDAVLCKVATRNDPKGIVRL